MIECIYVGGGPTQTKHLVRVNGQDVGHRFVSAEEDFILLFEGEEEGIDWAEFEARYEK